jgi:hypothetical protein
MRKEHNNSVLRVSSLFSVTYSNLGRYFAPSVLSGTRWCGRCGGVQCEMYVYVCNGEETLSCSDMTDRPSCAWDMNPLPCFQLQKHRRGLHTIKTVKVAHPTDYRTVVETRSEWARVQAGCRVSCLFQCRRRILAAVRVLEEMEYRVCDSSPTGSPKSARRNLS